MRWEIVLRSLQLNLVISGAANNHREYSTAAMKIRFVKLQVAGLGRELPRAVHNSPSALG